MKTRNVCRAVIAFGAFAAAAATVGSLAAGQTAVVPSPLIPPVLYTDLPGQGNRVNPTWIGADEAIDAQGRLSDLFSEESRQILSGVLVQPAAGRCIEVNEFFDTSIDRPGRGSLAQAVARDPLIVRGKVTAIAPGFKWGEPGRLYRLDVDQAYRAAQPLDFYYFFVPVGRFRSGPYEICKTDFHFTAVPEIGDEVILLVPEIVASAEPMLRISRTASLILLKSDGQVVLPRRYREGLQSLTRDGLLGWIERTTGEAVER